LLGVAVLAVKLGIFVCDHEPRLFLGDSASYLHSALSGWVPPDRSFLYGFMIGWLALPLHRLDVVVLAQVMTSAATVVLLIAIVRKTAGRGCAKIWWLAGFLVFAPIQLTYERFILTETVTEFVVVAQLVLAAGYLRNPRVIWLLGMAFLSFFMVALRVSVLPNIIVGAFLVPLLGWLPRWFGRSDGEAGKIARTGVSHLILSVLLTVAGLVAYQCVYAHVSGNPPGFHSRQGYFLLATVSPLVRPEDLPDAGLRAAVYAPGGIDPRDASMRNAQLFMSQGMLPRMERYLWSNPLATDRLARKIAVHVILRHPMNFVRLGWQNARVYLTQASLANLARLDRGDRAVSPEFQEILVKRLNFHPRSTVEALSPVLRFFSSALIWYQFLFLGAIPLAMASIVIGSQDCDRPRSGLMILVGIHLLVAMGVTIWLAPAASLRYLHLIELLFILTAGLVFLGSKKEGRV
jgi:hypothetical protein